MRVTGEQVRAAMEAAEILVVPHHDCSLCGHWTNYQRVEGRLYYCSGCGCSYSQPTPRSWDDAADWINMQSDPQIRGEIQNRFGLDRPTSSPLTTDTKEPEHG